MCETLPRPGKTWPRHPPPATAVTMTPSWHKKGVMHLNYFSAVFNTIKLKKHPAIFFSIFMKRHHNQSNLQKKEFDWGFAYSSEQVVQDHQHGEHGSRRAWSGTSSWELMSPPQAPGKERQRKLTEWHWFFLNLKAHHWWQTFSYKAILSPTWPYLLILLQQSHQI